MKNKKILQMAQMAILIAILLIFSFTPLGYIKAGPVEITLMILPVAIGAVVLGPFAGGFLGLIFGITSAVQGFTGVSAFGMALMNADPFLFTVLCILPRILCGVVPGVLYRILPGKWSDTGKCVLCSLSCAVTNTVLFVGLMILFFGNCAYISTMRNGKSLLLFLVGFVGINGLVEIAVSALVGGGIARIISAVRK